MVGDSPLGGTGYRFAFAEIPLLTWRRKTIYSHTVNMQTKTTQPQTKMIFRRSPTGPGCGFSICSRAESCVFVTSSLFWTVPQPTVSRHLAYLRKAGLVVARKEGLWMHYRLAPARSKSHEMLLECLTQCFREESGFREGQGAAPVEGSSRVPRLIFLPNISA